MGANLEIGNNNNSGNSNENWKSDRFINLSLVDDNGDEMRLGAIGLKKSDPNHARIIQALDSDPSKLDIVLSKVSANYRSAEKTERSFSFLD